MFELLFYKYKVFLQMFSQEIFLIDVKGLKGAQAVKCNGQTFSGSNLEFESTMNCLEPFIC